MYGQAFHQDQAEITYLFKNLITKAVLLAEGLPKAPDYEIWGTHHLSFVQKVSFSSRLKTKVQCK